MFLLLFTVFLITAIIQISIVKVKNTTNIIKQKEQKKFIKIYRTGEVPSI